MAGDKTNPSLVGTANQYSGQNVALSGPIGLTLEAKGNTVDPARIVKTLNVLDKNMSQAHPLGQDGTTGY